MNGRAVVAELIAAFGLVFVGGGAGVMDGMSGGALGLVGIALAHGVVLMTMVYATGHISGAHVNPAVTLSLLATGNIDAKNAVGYILGQLSGAVIAAVLLRVIFSGFPAADLHLSVPDLGAGVSLTTGILVELVLTFFLAFAVFGTAVDKRAPRGVYGLAIGFVLIFDILMGGPLTGAAVNPARAFGPALVAGHWNAHVVYWIGPVIGALIAGLVYKHLLLDRAPAPR
jgi:MIP family channel proteins